MRDYPQTNILSRSKLACTSIKLSESHCATAIELYTYEQVTVRLCQKEPLFLVLQVLDQTFIYVKGHVPILDLAIVQVFQLTQPLCGYIKVLNLVIVQVYSNNITQRCWIKTKLPAYLQGIHN